MLPVHGSPYSTRIQLQPLNLSFLSRALPGTNRKGCIVNPEISVIIPAYNRFKMLVHVIDSILAQTVPVFEIIVIDDGSQDETAQQMARRLAEIPAWSKRVLYFRQENQGQSAAVNRGLSLARGSWIAVAAHDDPWLPWKLEWQLRALRKFSGECELCFTDAWFMNNPHMKQSLFQFTGFHTSETLGIVRDPTRLIVKPHPAWVQTVLASAELFHRIGGLDAHLHYCEDDDLLFRAALHTNFCYVGMPMVLIDRSPADVRHMGPSELWHKAEYTLSMQQCCFEKQLSLGAELPRQTRILIRDNLRATHSHWANCHLHHHDYAKARQAARTAVRYRRTFAAVLKWLLISVAPSVARAIFVARDRNGAPRVDRTSWLSDSSTSEGATEPSSIS